MELAGLTERIAAARGAGIAVLPAKDLRILDGGGKRRRFRQAVEIVYTRPTGACVVEDSVEVKEVELPDVVLQAAASADARHRTLSRYEKWGFPEVWVEVPDRRRKSRLGPAPGLAIHLLTRLGYVQSPTSAAFPSWSAEEIHAALNEPQGRMSAATATALRRVGRLMRAEATNAAIERDESGAEATTEARIDALDEIFQLRGFAVSPSFADHVASLKRPLATLLRTAYDSRDEDDLLERLGVVRELPLTP